MTVALRIKFAMSSAERADLDLLSLVDEVERNDGDAATQHRTIRGLC